MKLALLSRFAPSGKYKLPVNVTRLLFERLFSRRNKGAAERACRLATFLAQKHALSGRAFPLDRRALFMAHGRRKGADAATRCSPDNPQTDGELDLTLDQIRAAFEILEAVGFVARAGLKRGRFLRAAVQWVFGFEFERAFSWIRKSPKGICFSLLEEKKEKKKEIIFGGVRRRLDPPSIPALPPVVNPVLEAILAKLGGNIARAGA